MGLLDRSKKNYIYFKNFLPECFESDHTSLLSVLTCYLYRSKMTVLRLSHVLSQLKIHFSSLHRQEINWTNVKHMEINSLYFRLPWQHQSQNISLNELWSPQFPGQSCHVKAFPGRMFTLLCTVLCTVLPSCFEVSISKAHVEFKLGLLLNSYKERIYRCHIFLFFSFITLFNFLLKYN